MQSSLLSSLSKVFCFCYNKTSTNATASEEEPNTYINNVNQIPESLFEKTIIKENKKVLTREVLPTKQKRFTDENEATVLCCSKTRPHEGQVDLFPRNWCCCSKYNTYDKNNNDKENNEPPPSCLRILWSFCFFIFCCPCCYPCYVSRSLRRRSKSRHESYLEVVKNCQQETQRNNRNKSDLDLFNKSSDEMSLTLKRHVSDTKRSRKSKRSRKDTQEMRANLDQGERTGVQVKKSQKEDSKEDDDDDDDEIAYVINVNVIILFSDTSFLLHDCLSTRSVSQFSLNKLDTKSKNTRDEIDGKVKMKSRRRTAPNAMERNSISKPGQGLRSFTVSSNQLYAKRRRGVFYGRDFNIDLLPSVQEQDSLEESSVKLEQDNNNLEEVELTHSESEGEDEFFDCSSSLIFEDMKNLGNPSIILSEENKEDTVILRNVVKPKTVRGGGRTNSTTTQSLNEERGKKKKRKISSDNVRRMSTALRRFSLARKFSVKTKEEKPTEEIARETSELDGAGDLKVVPDEKEDDFSLGKLSNGHAVRVHYHSRPSSPQATFNTSKSSSFHRLKVGQGHDERPGNNNNKIEVASSEKDEEEKIEKEMGPETASVNSLRLNSEQDETNNRIVDRNGPSRKSSQFLRRFSLKRKESFNNGIFSKNNNKRFSSIENPTSEEVFGESSSDGESEKELNDLINRKTVTMRDLGGRTEIVSDLGYQLSLSMFDEATVSEWKGTDLKLAKEMPNMDVIVLAVRKNNLGELKSVMCTNSGMMSYFSRFWRGFYPLLFIEIITNGLDEVSSIEEHDQETLETEFANEVKRLGLFFDEVHHIQIESSELARNSDFIYDCVARLFVHSRLYQCSRFYSRNLANLAHCPGGCDLRKSKIRDRKLARKRVYQRRKAAEAKKGARSQTSIGGTSNTFT